MRLLPYAVAAIVPLLLPNIPQQPKPAATGQPESYTLRANAKLVVLDVVVTDKDGNPVTNLNREDFDVQEDKQPQRIYSFETPAAHAPPHNVVIHSTEELDRLAPNATTTIIVLDEFTSTFGDIYTAHTAIQRYLKAQPQLLSQPTMLVAVNVDKMNVLHDYTQDRDALLSAINHHDAGPADRSGAVPRNGVGFGMLQVEASFRSLTQIAQATTGHAGHKNVVWVGHGLSARGESSGADLRGRIALQKEIDLLIASRVTLSTIDLRGPGFNHAPIGEAPVTFAEVAVSTGGKNLYNRNDVDQMIFTSVRNGDQSYTLSYIPTSSGDAKAAFRHIRVIMKNPNLRVTTRTGYYPDSEKEPGSEVAKDMASWHPRPKNVIDQTIINTKLVYDGIPLTLTRSATPGEIIVHMNADALPWIDHGPNQPRTAPVQISCVSFDKKEKVLVHSGTDTDARSPASASQAQGSQSVSFSLNCDTDPHAVLLRVVVQAKDSDKIGAANLDLTAK